MLKCEVVSRDIKMNYFRNATATNHRFQKVKPPPEEIRYQSLQIYGVFVDFVRDMSRI